MKELIFVERRTALWIGEDPMGGDYLLLWAIDRICPKEEKSGFLWPNNTEDLEL